MCSSHIPFLTTLLRLISLFGMVIYGLIETKYTQYGIFLTVVLSVLVLLQITRFHRIFYPSWYLSTPSEENAESSLHVSSEEVPLR